MENGLFKIALVPADMAWGDIEENLMATAHALHLVAEDTDLVVLPEMFSTGFITEPTILTTIDADRCRHTLDDVKRWAAHFHFAICGSFLDNVDGQYYNRGFFVEPSGETTFYDKRHLFSMGGEARTYTAGTRQSPIVRYCGCNIKLLVCYDLRFPVWARNVDCEYDLLIYPANWPESRAYAWTHLLIARAIENQAYVAGCNRTGSDDFGTYPAGLSAVYNDWGQPVSTTDAATGIVYATVDIAKLIEHRRKFPTWRDADTFTIDI